MDLYGGRDTVGAECAALETHKAAVWQIAFVESHRAKK